MNYPYAVGSIKALEGRIMDRGKLSKLIRCEKSEFLKTLKELGYGSGSKGESLEVVIEDELTALKHYFDEISPDREFTDWFFMVNDALNLKILYKRKIFGVEIADIFSGSGTLKKEQLEKAVLGDDFTDLSPDLEKLVKSINEKIEGNLNPRLISCIIDNVLFETIFKRLRFQLVPALKTYFQAFIDCANVLTWLRSRLLNWDYSQFQQMFISNGTIKAEVFSEAYLLNGDAVAHCFRDYYDEKIAKALKGYFERPRLGQVEKRFDDLILELMSFYKDDSFSIGPIIYYYLEKISEAKNIRLIYSSTYLDPNDLLEY